MVIDGLLAAEPHLHIAEQVFKPERYLHLTDNIMPTIEASTSPVSSHCPHSSRVVIDGTTQELAPARAIFERIRNRELYKMVDFKSLAWKDRAVLKEYITPELIVEAANELPDSSSLDKSELRAEDVIVDFCTMHYGMKDKNPLDFVKFYSKRIPDSMFLSF